MNEFIVWDEDSQEFSTYDELISDEWCVSELDTEGNIKFKYSNCAENDWEHDYNDMNTKLFYYIGKTDINNKKIYADSSIVEFDRMSMNNPELEEGVIAYIAYDNNRCCYDLCFGLEKDAPRISISDFTPFLRSEFKIIDTIQENKLGLIK